MRNEPRVFFEVDEMWEAETWRSVVVRGVFEEVATEDDRGAVLAALHGRYPDDSHRAGSGVTFRIRPTEKTGRTVHAFDPVYHLSDVEHPLQGIDLRAGAEADFPDSDDV